MGLFDKRDLKKKGKEGDDFDSPVERIDLSSAMPPSEPPTVASGELGAAANADGPAATAEPSYAPPSPPPAHSDDDFFDAPDYGIDKAIELMRTLPQDNVELVVQVVKITLESTRVKIGDIIEDASRKQTRITDRISVLRSEIAEFEAEIATRKEEITGLEADMSETSSVKERLEMAEGLSKSGSSGRAAGTSMNPTSSSAYGSKSGSVSGTHAVNRPMASSSSASSTGGSSALGRPKTTVVVKK